MPLFYFNHSSVHGFSVDDVGTEFQSLEAAYLDACAAILEIAFEKLRARQDPAEDFFEIANQQGDVLLIVPFREVLQPRGSKRPPAYSVGSPMATSLFLMKKSRILEAIVREEVAKAKSEIRAMKTNMARLDAACSFEWCK